MTWIVWKETNVPNRSVLLRDAISRWIDYRRDPTDYPPTHRAHPLPLDDRREAVIEAAEHLAHVEAFGCEGELPEAVEAVVEATRDLDSWRSSGPRG